MGTMALNSTYNQSDEVDFEYSTELLIFVTSLYSLIFVTGVVGNVSTCVVISCNKHMHTATNFYLFSLAVSDMVLLISGLPPEMYRLWSPTNYIFGEVVCILQGFAAETSANATVLTITAFTVERYVAICHPFLSHTFSKLSRATRCIIGIWILALCLAAPQAIQFGVQEELKNGTLFRHCTVVSNTFQHAFEISTFLFFVGPMTLITVLYVLIGIQLRTSRRMTRRGSLRSSFSNEGRARSAQNRVVKMLVAVVAAFFICWAPFHAQRLLAVYLRNASKEAQKTTLTVYMVLNYGSGILYFLSTTINPVLYNIMSNRFRDAFKKTFSDLWCRSPPRPLTQTYSVLSRCAPARHPFQRSVSDGVKRDAPEEARLQTTKSTSFLGWTSDAPKKIQQPIALAQSKPSMVTSLESNSRLFRLFGGHQRADFSRQCSADSGNTISNSSLQDMDEIDFSSSDLVRYMEEVNEDIA